MAISRTSEKAVPAIEVLELMNNDVVFNNLLNYGVEGTHYNFVDEEAGVIESIEGSGYAPNMQWALQNQFNTYLFPAEDPEKWDKYRAFNESARLAVTIGFTADQNPIRTQLASISTAQEPYIPLLQRGLVDPNELREEFLAAMEAAGIREVEEELTRQVRDYLATK
jgi:putative aldouronate transport system substrate-binding protein